VLTDVYIGHRQNNHTYVIRFNTTYQTIHILDKQLTSSCFFDHLFERKNTVNKKTTINQNGTRTFDK